MAALRSLRWVCSLGVVSLFPACKAKPAPPSVNITCEVSDLTIPGDQTVNVTADFVPVGAEGRPAGTLVLEVSEVSVIFESKCNVQGSVPPAPSTAPHRSTLAFAFPPSCVGTPPAGRYISIRSFFTPEHAVDRIECAVKTPVPVLWGGVPEEQKNAANVAPTTSAATAPDARTLVYVDIKDALRFPNGKVDESPEPVHIYMRVPNDWIAAGALTEKAKTVLLAKMYGGPNWQKGNYDGSLYIVRSVTSRVLPPDQVTAQIWNHEGKTAWFYETLPDGSLDNRGPNFGPPREISPAIHLNQR